MQRNIKLHVLIFYFFAMPKIHLLEDFVINQIAAGEVIERPASAVKELVENSLDSGATNIRISVKRGGKELIQIQDDGSGMGDSDLELSVLRHATSKLLNTDDLFKLSTNGFRGEALASIASISKMTIESREKIADGSEVAETGIKAIFEGGILKSKEETAIPVGTIISVDDLFFNAPVRAEFLKSDSVENSRILDSVIRLAIANPNVRFEYKSNGRIQFFSAQGDLQTRIADALGANVAKSLLPVNWEESGVSVSGFVSKPEDINVGKRNIPYLYLQKRPIWNGLIAKAINQAYSPYGEGQPIAVLFLDMPLETFDVNVHPQKKEVRFSRDNAVFLAVHHAVHNALQNAISYPSLSSASFEKHSFAPSFSLPSFETEAETNRVEDSAGKNFLTHSETFQQQPERYFQQSESQEQLPNQQTEPANQQQELFPNQKILPFPKISDSDSNDNDETIRNDIAKAFSRPLYKNDNAYLQVAKQYILCESGSSVLFIDQNAAHKRILFEKALIGLQNRENLDSQELLFTETLDIPHHLMPILEEQQNNLKQLGFHLEHFGGTSWQIRSIPIHLPLKMAKFALLQFLNTYEAENVSNASAQEAIFRRIAISWANGSAIQSGTELSQSEMEFIVSNLLLLQNPYETPQGDAIFMKMPVEDIRKRF